MIRFNCLIHKETGTVIKYEEWKEAAKDDNYITILKETKLFISPKKIVKARDMLFDDEFGIVYGNDFTLEDLNVINEYGIGTFIDEYEGTGLWEKEMEAAYNLRTKINELIGDREYYKKYGIEV